MSGLSGDLGRWAKVQVPRVDSSEGLRDIHVDVLLVDSQFAEWLAGGRRADGKEFDWLRRETSQLLKRIDNYPSAAPDVSQAAALRGFVERMKRIMAGDESAFLQ